MQKVTKTSQGTTTEQFLRVMCPELYSQKESKAAEKKINEISKEPPGEKQIIDLILKQYKKEPTMNITVTKKKSWGNQRYYINEVQIATAFTMISNCKTLEHRHIVALKALGHSVIVTHIEDSKLDEPITL